jgi:hypothetical protein
MIRSMFAASTNILDEPTSRLFIYGCSYIVQSSVSPLVFALVKIALFCSLVMISTRFMLMERITPPVVLTICPLSVLSSSLFSFQYMYGYMHACVCVFVYVCVHEHVYVYICLFVYMYSIYT